MRICSSCGCPRFQKEDRCQECGSSSFGLTPNLTYKNWQRRNNTIKTSRIIIYGPDDWDDERFIKRKLDRITRKLQDVVVITGSRKGVSRIATDWAYLHGYTTHVYHVKEGKDKREANIVRNTEMVEDGNAKFLIIFNDGNNSAVINLIVQAKKAGLIVRNVNLEDT